MAVMETVSVDNPPGDIAMLDEALGGFERFDSFLHTRTLAGWGAPGEGAVVLNIEIKFNILDTLGQWLHAGD
jgi:hypothetical protein